MKKNMTHNKLLLLVVLLVTYLSAVAQVPSITNFSPTNGNAGTIVTITGTNFSTTPANNVVYFGLMKGTVTNATANSLQVTTPLGASYDPITVINIATGLTTISINNFMPTFSGGTPGFKYRQTWDDGYEGHIVTDFDGDGKCNLASAGPTIYKNNSAAATANFSNPVNSYTAGLGYLSTYELKYADFNGDGKLDVFGGVHNPTLVNGSYHTDLGVSKNTTTAGNVSFAAEKLYFYVNDVPGRFFTAKSRAGDFDMDGKLDIVVYDYDHQSTISIYRNQSTISNIDFAAKLDLPANLPSGFITSEQPLVGDINDDGKPDLIYGVSSTVNASDVGLLVYINASTGPGNFSFATPVFYNFNIVALPLAFKYADINNDGKMDIIGSLFSTYPTPGNSFICLNTSTGGNVSFAAPMIYGTPKKSDRCELSDINGDGKLDFVTLNSFDGDSSIYVFTNTSVSNANISFDTTKYRIKSQQGWSWGEVTIGDLDNDGKPDIVVGKVDYYSGSYNSTTNSYPHSTSILFNGYAPPTATVNVALDTFSVCSNIPSVTQSFTVASTYLPANMVISAPTSIEVSLSPNSGFGSSITITPVAGTIATTTIYVRAAAVNSAGLSTFTGSINVSSDAIVPITIPAVVMYNAGNWNGHTNNDFHNAGNWTGCYPAANINITIPNVVTSPLLTQVGTLNDLTINAGASLEITGKLQISGNVSNLGVFDADKGTVELNNATTATKYISTISPLAGKIHRLIINQTSVYTNTKLFIDSLTLTLGTLFNNDSLNIAQAITKTSGTIDCSTTSSNVLILNGTTPQTLPISYFTNKTLQHLVVSNKAGVSTVGNVAVNGKLTLTGGVLMANNDTIIMPSGSSASSTSGGYVDGNIRKTGNSAFTFPVGNGGRYAPISIGLSSSSSDQFTASYVHANPNSLFSTSSLGTGLNRVSQAEYWLLKRTGGTNTQTVTLSWDTGHSVAPGLATNARVAGWDGTKWVNQGNTATTGSIASGTVKSNTGLNTFGAFTLGSSVAAATNADLFSLTVNGQSPSPVFNANTFNYTSIVSTSTATAFITPQAFDAAALIYINGVYLSTSYLFANLAVGDNTYTITVVAGDGVTTKTYTLVVTRVTDANADLSNLIVSSGTLTPAFSSSNISYVDTVITTVSSITVTPTALNSANPTNINVNGVPVNSGSASGAISLNFGNNTITTVVTSIDGSTTKTYTVNVFRKADNNCNLSALVVNTATISPVFASATTSYTAAVINTVTSVTIKPTTAVTTATVKVNGVTVTSGSNSGSIPLSIGSNTITVLVTAQDGTTTKTYTITITRAGGTNANLSALTLSTGTLSPAFNTNTITYTVSVVNSVTSISITPTLTDVEASLKVNTVSSASGAAYGPINLNVGSNTITIVGTASNGTTTKTYTVTVTRATSTVNTLSDLQLSSGILAPAFASTTTSYTASVANAISSITVTPTVTDATATVKVNGTLVTSGTASGNINLNVGTNTITVLVTAQNLSTKTYTITVTRSGSSNPDLSALTLSAGAISPVFAAATTAYTVSVSNATTSTTVTPTVASAGATIKVNNVTVSSGGTSGAISLAVGNTTINVVVTSGDGTTTKTYTVVVTRAASGNANLSALSLTSMILSPVFASATISYTSSVTNTINTTRVTPTVADATATIQVNGITVTSGTLSGAIALNVGSNTITIVVTAQDGITTKTYTVIVTRAASNIATLSALSISTGTLSPFFNSATINYTTSVNASTIKLTPTVSDATATVTVNGVPVTSGTASGNISLNVGSNTIAVIVTAGDGTTTKTYTVTVTRTCTPTTSISNLSICASQIPYNWNGTNYTTAGTYIVHLTNANGCDSAATLILTINASSAAGVSIVSDANNICPATTVTFTATPTNGGTAPVYQWIKNGVNVGTNSSTYTINTLANNDTVWCVLTSNSACATVATATSNKIKMILKTAPVAPVIYLTSVFLNCSIGSSTPMSSNYWNTSWSSSNPTVATVTYPGPSGTNGTYVNGLSNGTTVITVTVTNVATGCSSTSSANYTVAAVTVAPIVAANGVCLNSTIIATNATPGGVWSFSNNKALVSTTGLVSGNSVGNGVLSYKVTNAEGCSATATQAISTYALPAPPTVSSLTAKPYCMGATFNVTASPTNGAWTTSNASVSAATGSPIIVTLGNSVGPASLTYTIADANGCQNSKITTATILNCIGSKSSAPIAESNHSSISLYPNPAKSVVSLKVDKMIGEGTIVLTDIYGKVVYTCIVNSPSTLVDISHLNKGLYLVSMITNEGKVTKKLMVE